MPSYQPGKLEQLLWDQRRENSAEPAKMFPAPDMGLCPLSLGHPFLSRPRWAEVTSLENLQYCYPLPPWVTHPGYSGGAWRQHVQVGIKGSEVLEESSQRVTKPWRTQPITFFSWLSKDLTHKEARPLKAELVKGRDRTGGVVPGLVGNQHTPIPADPGQVEVQVGTGDSTGFCLTTF